MFAGAVGRPWWFYDPLLATTVPARDDAGHGSMDDPGFLARLRQGDPRAFEQVVREAGGRLLAVARRMLRNEENAQDAVQEAFLSAFKSVGKFSGESKLTTWLHRILVNVCLMKIRSQSRRPERSIEAMLPTFADNGHFSVEPTGWTRAKDEDMGDDVRAAMADLPEPYREVLVLRDVAELDTAQAAKFLGVSENNVKTRLHRARLALRQLIDERIGETKQGKERRA